MGMPAVNAKANPTTARNLCRASLRIRPCLTRCSALKGPVITGDASSSTQRCAIETSPDLLAHPAANRWDAVVPGCLALGVCLATSAWPSAAHASEEALTGQAMELFAHFLEQVRSMGPAGELLFVTTVMVTEMVPLFPTQPLSLASGLLFGTQKGALLMLLGVTLAATNAFLIARGVGRPLAQRVIDAEMSHADDGNPKGAMAKTMAKVQTAIETGGFWKQMAAVIVVRFTPVIPFSASNYLLGLTPLQFPALLAGTLVGMSVWSTVYAGLGGASARLLDKGANMEDLLTDLADKAAALSSSALGLTAGAVGLAAAVYAVRAFTQQQQGWDVEGPSGGGTTTDDDAVEVERKQKLLKQEQAVGSGVGRAGSPSRRGRD